MQPKAILRVLILLPALSFAACGGGANSSSGSAAPSSASLQLVVDPATGSDLFVDVQLAAAALQRPDGSYTGNLLRDPLLFTLADPTAAPRGLRLQPVPAGEYRELRLLLVPGSGVAVQADGSRLGVDFASVELALPFDVLLQHDGIGSSWVAAHHVGAAPAIVAGRVAWAPQLRGGAAAGVAVADVPLQVLLAQPGAVLGSFAGGDLRLELEHGAEVFDDRGGRVGDAAAFLGGLQPGSRLEVQGLLDDRGGLRGQRVREVGDDHGGSAVRLLGRIVDLAPASRSFTMDVLAEVLHGDRSLLATPQRITVLADAARIHRSDLQQALGFAELGAGDLVKVRWTLRNGSEVRASEVELERRAGAPAAPEIEGRVGSVEVGRDLIVVLPRRDDPLLLNGVAVDRLEVTVTAATRLERRDAGSIGLADVVAGSDRIWIRGTATGPQSVTADWIRVRAE